MSADSVQPSSSMKDLRKLKWRETLYMYLRKTVHWLEIIMHRKKYAGKQVRNNARRGSPLIMSIIPLVTCQRKKTLDHKCVVFLFFLHVLLRSSQAVALFPLEPLRVRPIPETIIAFHKGLMETLFSPRSRANHTKVQVAPCGEGYS